MKDKGEGTLLSEHLDIFEEIEVDVEEKKNEITKRVRKEQPQYDMGIE